MIALSIDPTVARLTALVAIVALAYLLVDARLRAHRGYLKAHTTREIARRLARSLPKPPALPLSADALWGAAAAGALVGLLYLLGIGLPQQLVVLEVAALLFGPEKAVRGVLRRVRGRRR